MKSWLLQILLALLCAVMAAACSDPNERDAEICNNDVDDDGDGFVDCSDSECVGNPACAGIENCANGTDDDGDGLADCDDSDCIDDPACTDDEICDNGVDDDGDGDTDCDDSDCTGVPPCVAADEICDDGEDNDLDGFEDCDDSDCADDPACEGVENCTNGEDDDDDGDIDCADSDCVDSSACQEDCDDGVDNDLDGDTDCADSDCTDDPLCESFEDCTNELDDDGDGDVDCADSDCVGTADCAEICDDGLDNDLDGDTDCGDTDCDGDPACSEICDNGTDDDGDDLIDCMDPSCDHDIACAELCNGLDDDGDGRIDEFPIEPSIGTACYGGDAALAGVGQCDEGVTECFDGGLACIGWIPPTDELCDGIDNDCDGDIPAAEDDCGTTVVPDELTMLELETGVRDVDIQFNLDTTGSMGGELAELRTSLASTIVPDIRAILPTAAFGFSTFDDFPFGSFGSEGAGDMPFILRQRVTTNVISVQDAIDGASTHSGADGPESGIESLYQIATGLGVSWAGDWSAEDCDDWGGSDEDGDGEANCADLDCVGETACWAWDMEDCNNGSDDDGDAYVDCDDPNCIYDWRCRGSYTPGPCGNGTINSGEECDDGNTTSGDGCDSSCDRESGCGNAYVGGSEECDDGNRVDGDGCSSSCEVEPAVCGDGAMGAGEQCDDGGTVDGDGCAADCMLEEDCGDGAVTGTEECDDGNTVDGDGCDGTCVVDREGVPVFDWTDGFDAGLGHGELGGVGFRTTSVPIIIHITDNTSHDADDYAAFDVDAHSAIETFDALDAIGGRIIGVRSGSAADSSDPTNLEYPLGMTVATGSTVPPCAFDGSAPRTSGACAADECCTDVGGGGVAPDAGGMCPLVFDIRGDGTGLDESIVAGIDALTRFASYELTVVPRDDPRDAIDALCFVESVGIAASAPPTGSCSLTPLGLDTDGDGVIDTLRDATPRTRVTFQIEAVNTDINDVDGDGDVAEACAGSGTYGLYVDIVADGAIVVASRLLDVVVP